MKAKKHAVMMQIEVLAVLRCLMQLYYLYLNQIRDVDFWSLLMGGISVEESRYIFQVVIYILPDFLFYYCICSQYIRQLKENYVYIFVREKNMAKWLRKYTALSFWNILLYEMASAALLFLAEACLQGKMEVQSGEFIVLILCQTGKLVVITVFCDILLVKFGGTVSVYAALLVLALPLFLTGVLYDMGGPWEAAVKYIPFNWCNYNYLAEIKAGPPVMLCLSAVFGGAAYLYLEKLFKDYEAA